MKLGKIDFCKITKITAIEIVTFILIIIGIGIYTSPYFLKDQTMQKISKNKANSAILTARLLEEFAQDKNALASTTAKKVCDELNTKMQNPYDKKAPAFTYELNCNSCNSVEFNDVSKTITITTYDKRGDMVARTIVSPPSFVKYEKD